MHRLLDLQLERSRHRLARPLRHRGLGEVGLQHRLRVGRGQVRLHRQQEVEALAAYLLRLALVSLARAPHRVRRDPFLGRRAGAGLQQRLGVAAAVAEELPALPAVVPPGEGRELLAAPHAIARSLVWQPLGRAEGIVGQSGAEVHISARGDLQLPGRRRCQPERVRRGRAGPWGSVERHRLHAGIRWWRRWGSACVAEALVADRGGPLAESGRPVHAWLGIFHTVSSISVVCMVGAAAGG